MKGIIPHSERPSATPPTITGTCFCGVIAIEIAGTPEEMGYCHCASCRACSGAPLDAFTLWRSEQVTVTRGTEFLGAFNKTGMSNRRFCTRCGGHVMAEHPDLGMTDVSAAVLLLAQAARLPHRRRRFGRTRQRGRRSSQLVDHRIVPEAGFAETSA